MGSQVLSVPDSTEEASGGSPVAAAAAGAAAAAAGGVWDGAADSGGVAVVVDAETTSYLMMGALSPGLKRHSVTLFEGGRVGGAAVMDELITELAASAAAGEFFEGDMVQLMRHIQSLGILLGVARSAAAGQGQALELLRKESLEGLDPESAAKVLSHAYTCIIPTAPLRGPSLPLSPFSPSSPTLYGPSAEADSPWLQLALYAAAAAGPLSLVLVAGQRVWRLPGQLEGCTHALLWGWAAAADGWAASPLLVEGSSLLCSLNELLARTAVLVQPLVHLQQLPSSNSSSSSSSDDAPLVAFMDVPLPLRAADQQQQQQQQQQGVAAAVSAATPAAAADAAAAAAVSDPFADLLQMGGSSSSNQGDADTAAAAAAAGAGEELLPVDQQPGTAKAADSTPRSSSTPHPQQQQQQQQQHEDGSITVLAVDRQQGGQLRRLLLPGNIVAALQQLQLTSAVGWLRLVKLPPAGPSGSSSSRAAACAGSGWVPLSLNLGVPLFCPTLCQQVCSNMSAAQCLTPSGRSAWRAAQLQLQQQLWQLVGQFGAGSGSSSSKAVGLGNKQPAAAAAAAAASGGGAMQVELPPGWRAAAAAAAGDGVELPACGLLFNGRALLPVDFGDCLQGVCAW
uniref:FAM91 C-terminal domain-containing protein n=1 Tax=Tetradesmus obliquus TaxID=3088 RepID=A0A383VSL6_TETOB|eukprot:jgi/Sobl393_1/9715/SZX67762.1